MWKHPSLLLCLIIVILKISETSCMATESSYARYLSEAQKSIEKQTFQNAFFYIETAHLLNPFGNEPFELLNSLPDYAFNKNSYFYYVTVAQEALNAQNIQKACFYFKIANRIKPQNAVVRQYLNLIKRIKEGRAEIPVEAVLKTHRPPQNQTIPRPLVSAIASTDESNGFNTKQKKFLVPKKIQDTVFEINVTVKDSEKPKSLKADQRLMNSKTDQKILGDEKVIELDASLWENRKQHTIKIGFKKAFLLKGHHIKRFLTITEGVLASSRIDENTIKIVGKKRASTLFHLWDDKGRWTFNIEVTLPSLEEDQKRRERYSQMGEEYVQPFKLEYRNNWGSFYKGTAMPTLKRTFLDYTQDISISGETPHGEMDASVTFIRLEEGIKQVGNTLGLTDGKWGPFEDFTLRGFDAQASYSDLSLPGLSFKGFLLESYAFQHQLKYTILKGQVRSTNLFALPKEINLDESFIEGVKMVLFPDQNHHISVQYVRGSGSERPSVLKKKVYSVQMKNTFTHWNILSEVAFDEDKYAGTIHSSFKKDDQRITINYRNMQKKFKTITGAPSDRGEIGVDARYDDTVGTFNLNSFLDIYRNNQFFNSDHPDAVNVDWSGSIRKPLSQNSNWLTALQYTDTQQLLSPGRQFSITNRLDMHLPLTIKDSITFFIGYRFQRKRFEKSPGSEYDRMTLSTGFRTTLFKNISYFANYDYSMAKGIATGEVGEPRALSTGLSYSHNLARRISLNTSLSYRNEENTEEKFSFLAGEDSLIGYFGLNYRPTSDFEFFMDTSMSNIWAENNNQIAFNSTDIRFGVRSSWNSFFRWNPKGVVQGAVFKDVDGDGIQGTGEAGIADVMVRVGSKKVITNQSGQYEADVTAKKVRVKLDANTIPSGFIASTDILVEYRVKQGKTKTINFGVTMRSGIYGIVYVDSNNNGRLDRNEKLIPNVRLRLDNKKTAISDYSGSYFFENIDPGTYIIYLDVNSLPKQHFPNVKIKEKVTVSEGTTYIYNIPLKIRKP